MNSLDQKLSLMILRVVSVVSTLGFGLNAVLGQFDPAVGRWVVVAGAAIAALGGVATAITRLRSPIVTSFLVFVGVITFFQMVTIQPFQTLGGFTLLALVVAICSYESMLNAMWACGALVLLGNIGIFYRSLSPAAAAVVFSAAAFVCVFSVVGFRHASEAALRDALHDPLTGLTNRRGVESAVEQLLRVAEKDDLRLACLVIDIDNFKSVNDRLGHAEGDRILIRTALVLSEGSRKNDIPVRLGGDEFAIFALVHSRDDALAMAQRWRASLESGKEDGSLTVSIGVAVRPTDDVGIGMVLAQADAALLRAKESGRNRVELN